jgi:multidrug efflux pump subunit AcrB
MEYKPLKPEFAEIRNTARFSVENPHIAWIFLFSVIAWGVYAYVKMPQAKDPRVPVRQAMIISPWPGQTPERVELLLTKKIEQRVSQNAAVSGVSSISRGDSSVVFVDVDEEGRVDVDKQFDDINLRLKSIDDLPDGAAPIQFFKDFGDTATLMLTVASPTADLRDLKRRTELIENAIRAARESTPSSHDGRPGEQWFSLVIVYPHGLDPGVIGRPVELLASELRSRAAVKELRVLRGQGFFAINGLSNDTDEQLTDGVRRFLADHLQADQIHPDASNPVLIRDPSELEPKLAEVILAKYSYRDLDDFTRQIENALKVLPMVSTINRSGVLGEQIVLNYSQSRLATHSTNPAELRTLLNARNTTVPGGTLDAGGLDVPVLPSGQFKRASEISDVIIGASSTGVPVYLRDLVELSREYESPPRFLNNFTRRDSSGNWITTRAITMSIQMRQGGQISQFGRDVTNKLAEVRSRLPADLVLARTSDQPRQVTENVDLFMRSLWEAVGLVVLVSLIGFWEWRSALLMALAIPITLAMTFGMMHALGVELQQVSIATLILALGLLIDDPVVAGDAIKRDLGEGYSPEIAAWLGPTKLAKAILFATITNIVAYLPFLALSGDVGKFIRTLPIVITCSLVASRIVSMTFIPLLARYLSRSKREPPLSERRRSGFPAFYYRVGGYVIEHRRALLVVSIIIPLFGLYILRTLPQQFFPKDLQDLSYVDVWTPPGTAISATRDTTELAEKVIVKTAELYRHQQNRPNFVLKSLTSFIGAGGPRFWFSASPESPQSNYAEIVIEVGDKHDTAPLALRLQNALSKDVPGAIIDVRQLETGKPIGVPVAIRISGEDEATLKGLAQDLKAIFRDTPRAVRVRDDWGESTVMASIDVESDRAAFTGLTNQDVAIVSLAALHGVPITTFREGDRQIPVVLRLRMEERSSLSDLSSLYVFSQRESRSVPLGAVAKLSYRLAPPEIRRYQQYRTVTVGAYPDGTALPSQVLNAALPRIREWQKTLPPGYFIEIAGEYREQVREFKKLAVLMGVSIFAIYLALVIQFRHAVKPIIVFAAIPYGLCGALLLLAIMKIPFGFMAFLGIASLIGVIVSHIIVLFDFIEDRQAHCDTLREALLDAGIIRLRPVLITVGATVIALFPLAYHGGPLWEPLCLAQIGGLLLATFVTLMLVPMLYSIFVLDLKIVKWAALPVHQHAEG